MSKKVGQFIRKNRGDTIEVTETMMTKKVVSIFREKIGVAV